MSQFPDVVFLFAIDAEAVLPLCPSGTRLIAPGGKSLWAIVCQTAGQRLHLSFSLPCLSASKNAALSRFRLLNRLNLPDMQWVEPDWNGDEGGEDFSEWLTTLRWKGFRKSKEFTLQGLDGRRASFTLTGTLGPGLPLPVGRLPQRLPLQLPSAEGLLGLNRRVSIVAPGNLQLTLLPRSPFANLGALQQLDEKRPLLLLIADA
jgi:hypothetical protein